RKAKGGGAPADIDLPGHHLCEGRRQSSGLSRRGLDVVLLEESQNDVDNARTAAGEGDGVAGARVRKRLDGRVCADIPIEIAYPRKTCTKDLDRGSSLIG